VDVSRLLAVEWRRLRTRRIFRVFVVIALFNIVVSGIWVFVKSNRDLAAASAARQSQIDQCERRFEPPPGIPPEQFGPGPGFCDLGDAKDPRFHLTDLPRTFDALSLVFIFAMWGLAASFVGAEWEAGTIGTLLTHEPRRGRVIVAKVVVVAIFAMVSTAILLALLSTALLPAAIVRGTTAGTGGPWVASTAKLGLRVIATSGLVAVFGSSLAMAARRTSVAIGVLLLAFLFGTILGQIVPEWTRWQLTENLSTFATGTNRLGGGRSVASAGVLLSIYAAGVFALTTLGFMRRDVV
jgi:ABC-type transport system involved in multi-copper enzyme maturation permease subunit